MSLAAPALAAAPLAEEPAFCAGEPVTLGAGQDAGAQPIGNAGDDRFCLSPED
ncbi:hypothetical protein LY632_04680 [Erythrobacter sp. SDW2]|uniref:hypothetical protein n=1 Tax=Erythrobacter sp. SDW2 TaxID=2907154 RepID=UPI001F1FAF48|nr:hypothetical protein [Erythrobacter sp. SDW2]UIP07699.1 hypothetical protein LY632_04680 [Erythrobacter sp. SDW2]